jgi:addiction module RelB/DinJ family antitoxin
MAQISIRIDDELREQTDRILGELGLNISAAVNIFARQIVRTRGIPFPLTLSENHAAEKRDAVRKLFEYADVSPNKPPNGYQFNRDDCYDR